MASQLRSASCRRRSATSRHHRPASTTWWSTRPGRVTSSGRDSTTTCPPPGCRAARCAGPARARGARELAKFQGMASEGIQIGIPDIDHLFPEGENKGLQASKWGSQRGRRRGRPELDGMLDETLQHFMAHLQASHPKSDDGVDDLKGKPPVTRRRTSRTRKAAHDTGAHDVPARPMAIDDRAEDAEEPVSRWREALADPGGRLRRSDPRSSSGEQATRRKTRRKTKRRSSRRETDLPRGHVLESARDVQVAIVTATPPTSSSPWPEKK
jgi:hypothetical protein